MTMLGEDPDARRRGAEGAEALQQARRTEAELLRATEALRASEERLRGMFNQAAVGMAVADLSGRFLELNVKFCNILDYTVDDLRQRTFRDITHPDDLPETEARVRQLLDGAVPDYAIEKRYRRKDGSTVWSLTSVTLLRDGQGRPLHFLGVIEDITARKQIEAALAEESRVLELLNETGRTLASTLDLRSIVQAVTDAGTSLSGAKFGAFFYNVTNDRGDAYMLYTLSGAPREAFEKFDMPRATALFGPTFRGDAPIRLDDVRQDPRYGHMPPHHGMPKGHLPVRSYLAVPVRSRSGEVIGGLFFGHPEPGVFTERAERLVVGVAAQAGIAIDNARLYEAAQQAAEERRTLLESERAARSAAERMSALKDQFLATLSHELRTPLNAILGWAQILRHGPKSEADLRKGLETIERNARVQTQLIGDLLDMSRIASGKVRLEMETVSPVAVVDGAIEALQPAADAKQLRIEKQIAADLRMVTGDAGRLQQVVWNLLSNAIKFTPEGGRVVIALRNMDDGIELRVQDSGVGIRPDVLPFVFERFRQGDASTTRKYGGLGLGLSIVKSLVEMHGGTVRAESGGEGHGATMVVTLPAASAGAPTVEQAPRVEAAAPAAPGATELDGVTVLVVDDQADARELVGRVLEDCGARVITAADAREALDLLQAHRPDVLVTDIGMPGADGFELLRRVRSLTPEQGGAIPAIALTAFARAEDRTRVLQAGFLVHISKPVDPAELASTVGSVVRRAAQT